MKLDEYVRHKTDMQRNRCSNCASTNRPGSAEATIADCKNKVSTFWGAMIPDADTCSMWKPAP